jgi:hypothetical protein
MHLGVLIWSLASCILAKVGKTGSASPPALLVRHKKGNESKIMEDMSPLAVLQYPGSNFDKNIDF